MVNTLSIVFSYPTLVDVGPSAFITVFSVNFCSAAWTFTVPFGEYYLRIFFIFLWLFVSALWTCPFIAFAVDKSFAVFALVDFLVDFSFTVWSFAQHVILVDFPIAHLTFNHLLHLHWEHVKYGRIKLFVIAYHFKDIGIFQKHIP